MIKISDWRPFVDEYVCDVIPSLVDKAVLRTLREFCQETYFWEICDNPIPLFEDKDCYRLAVDYDVDILGITCMYQAGREVVPMTETANSGRSLLSENLLKGNEQIYYEATLKPDVIRFFPSPMDTSPVIENIMLAVKPSMTATEVGDSLMEEFVYAIADGAAAHLLSLPKPWQDLDQATIRRSNYKREVSRAKSIVYHDRSLAQGRVEKVKLQGSP